MANSHSFSWGADEANITSGQKTQPQNCPSAVSALPPELGVKLILSPDPNPSSGCQFPSCTKPHVPVCAAHLPLPCAESLVSRILAGDQRAVSALSHTEFIVAGILAALDVWLCLSFTLQCYIFPFFSSLTPSLLFHPLLTPAQPLHFPSCALNALFSATDFKFCSSARSSCSKEGKATCPDGKLPVLLRKMNSASFALQELPGWAQGGWT